MVPSAVPATPVQIDAVVSGVARQHGTPFYLFEEARFANNIERFRRALTNYHDKVVIGYSFKTNYTPSICRTAKAMGCFAEVVSRIELELASSIGFEHGKVIFNGPLKSLDDIPMAIRLGAIINFDHLDQIRILDSLSRTELNELRAGLRVNIDLNSTLLDKKIAKGGIVPRFGMHGSDLSTAKTRLDSLGVTVVSLHGHCSSSDRSPGNYTIIAQELLAVRSALALPHVAYLNVGGGFSGRVPTVWNVADAPGFDDYAKAIFEPLFADDWFRANRPSLVIEPGMSVVADAVVLVTRIISQKVVANHTVLGVDASFYNVRPTYHTKALTHRHIKAAGSGAHETTSEGNTMVSRGNAERFVPDAASEEGPNLTEVRALVGATCMERDILLENIRLDRPEIGDLILIEDVGAYCSVLSPNFITRAPPIYDLKPDGTVAISRRMQSFADFFAGFEL